MWYVISALWSTPPTWGRAVRHRDTTGSSMMSHRHVEKLPLQSEGPDRNFRIRHPGPRFPPHPPPIRPNWLLLVALDAMTSSADVMMSSADVLLILEKKKEKMAAPVPAEERSWLMSWGTKSSFSVFSIWVSGLWTGLPSAGASTFSISLFFCFFLHLFL